MIVKIDIYEMLGMWAITDILYENGNAFFIDNKESTESASKIE